MDVFSVLVTGANRGIGLEFVRQLVRLPKSPSFVFATYRSSEKLQALTEIKTSAKNSQVVLIKMDVTILEDIVAARKIVEEAVGENGLTLLINNAGMAHYETSLKITEEELISHFRSNAMGPIMVFQEMLPLLQKSASRNSTVDGLHVSKAAVLNISSMMGSITKTGDEYLKFDVHVPSYKISKAALNMGMRIIAASVKDQGILVVLMCPGWVKTDMGTDKAHLTPEESISAMLGTLPNLNESHHGSFMDRSGNLYPF